MNYCYEDARCLLDFQRVPKAEIILQNWIKYHELDLVDFHHNLFFGLRSIPNASQITPTVVTLHDYWTLDPRGQLFNNKHKNIQHLDNSSWQDNVLQTWQCYLGMA